jgi:hypothetical protein
MRTEARPSGTRPGSRLPFVVLAEIAMAIGVALVVLGIYEVGGLLSLGFGLLLIFTSSIPLILNPGTGTWGFDRELRRLMDGD